MSIKKTDVCDLLSFYAEQVNIHNTVRGRLSSLTRFVGYIRSVVFELTKTMIDVIQHLFSYLFANLKITRNYK